MLNLLPGGGLCPAVQVEYLRSVPLEVREEMVARGREIRCMFVYNVDVTSCNAFAAIMHQLEMRKRKMHQVRLAQRRST